MSNYTSEYITAASNNDAVNTCERMAREGYEYVGTSFSDEERAGGGPTQYHLAHPNLIFRKKKETDKEILATLKDMASELRQMRQELNGMKQGNNPSPARPVPLKSQDFENLNLIDDRDLF